MEDIPIRHQCQATKSIDALQAEIEVLRLDLRDMESKHHEDVRRLWTRIAVLGVIVAGIAGNHDIINIIIGLIT